MPQLKKNRFLQLVSVHLSSFTAVYVDTDNLRNHIPSEKLAFLLLRCKIKDERKRCWTHNWKFT